MIRERAVVDDPYNCFGNQHAARKEMSSNRAMSTLSENCAWHRLSMALFSAGSEVGGEQVRAFGRELSGLTEAVTTQVPCTLL